jgi:hypothetical protein
MLTPNCHCLQIDPLTFSSLACENPGMLTVYIMFRTVRSCSDLGQYGFEALERGALLCMKLSVDRQ